MRNPEIWIGLIILGFLLFGAKKMPDAARGLGRSLRIFKSEIKAMDDENQQQGQIPTGYQQQPGQPVYQQPGQPVYQQQPPVYQQPQAGQPVYQQQPAQPVYQQQPAYQPQAGQPVYQQQPVYQPPAPVPAPVDPAQAEHREAQ